MDEMKIVNALFEAGLVINALIYVPQIIRLIRVKTAKNISLAMFMMFNLTQAIQIAYAYFHNDIYYGYGMAVILVFSLTVTLLIIYYRAKPHKLMKFLSTKAAIIYAVMFAFIILLALFMIGYLASTSSQMIIVQVLYALSFIAVIVAAIPQLVSLYWHKNAKELSIITFVGFNFIQIVSAWHAYLYQEWLFFLGMVAFFIIYSNITGLILYYRISSSRRGVSRNS